MAACNSQSANVQSSNPQPSATPSAAAKPLVVATSPWVGFRGQYIAAAKDFFKAEGITVSEQPFQAATDVNTALAAGKVDLAWTGGADAIIAKNLGVSAAEVPAQLAGIHPFDIATNKSEVFNSKHPLYLVKSLDTASQTLYSLGKIPQRLDASKLVDDSLINTLAVQQ